jgi:F-type H+-transporting ATPase subunit epsilon
LEKQQHSSMFDRPSSIFFMKISILDAQHTIFEGAVSQATLPGADGELNILDDHETVFAVLTKGLIRLKPFSQKVGAKPGSAQESQSSGPIKPIPIRQGLARMRNNELVILVE